MTDHGDEASVADAHLGEADAEAVASQSDGDELVGSNLAEGAPGEPGAASPEEAEPENVDALAARARELLGEVEIELAKIAGALERLEGGRYGTCEVCGQPIGDELLQQDPTRTSCADHG